VGQVWEKYAGAIRDAAVRYEAASQKAKAAWAAIIGQLAPAFSAIMDKTSGLPLIQAAEKFGRVLSDAFKAAVGIIQNGDILATLSAAGEYFLAQMTNATDYVLRLLGDNLPVIFSAAVELFGLTLSNVFVASTQIFAGLWLQAVGMVAGYLLEVAASFGESLLATWEAMPAVIQSVANFLQNLFVEAFVSLHVFFRDGLIDGIKNIAAFLLSELRAAFDGAVSYLKGLLAGVDLSPEGLKKTGGKMTTDGVAKLGENTGAAAAAIKGLIGNIKLPRGLDIGGKAGDALAKIKDILAKGLSGFGSKSPGDIENTTIGQRYAVSSLAAIGGGGNVGPTSSQTLLVDHARRQTDLQMAMLQELRVANGRAGGSAGANIGNNETLITNF